MVSIDEARPDGAFSTVLFSGKAMTDLRSLAGHLGLSITTVSRALAGYPDVSAKTRARVEEAARAFGYRPNRLAQRLKSGRADAIGLPLPRGSGAYGDAFFAELIAAIGGALAERDLDLVVTASSRGGEDEVAGVKRLIDGGRVDGVIVPRTLWDDPRVDHLLAQGVPFVAHGRTRRAAEHAWHDVDGEAAIMEAMDRLYGFGHRRIAFLGAPQTYSFARYRLAGYQRFLAEHDIRQEQELIAAAPATVEAGAEAAASLMSLGLPPTAIMCATDRLAYGALQAIRAAGLEPGRDVSVIGYDDLMASAHQTPPLTTMRQSIRDEGRVLVDALVAVINGEKPQRHQDLACAVLVPRASDGPAPRP